MKVIGLLKSTAVEYKDPADPRTAVYPNNFYGWGSVNAWNAVKQIGFVGSNSFVSWQTDSLVYLAVRAFSTSGINRGLSRAYYSYAGVDYSSSRIFLTDTLNQFAFIAPLPGSSNGNLYFYFDLVDSSGKHLDVPYYGPAQPFSITGLQPVKVATSDKFLLYDGYPNPFTSQIHIPFVLYAQSQVTAEVFDVLGRKVKTIFNGGLPAGYEELSWNGTTDHGNLAVSGVYFIRMMVDGLPKVCKVLLLR
ncbi:MAG: T9SS type A sorting domain-containing protein, partial [Bacteroidetes bacterium]|nr:T9SS type A sorting domain-containing protein [Bacteroidota bacterium]